MGIEEYKELRAEFEKNGQGHVFAYWESLTHHEREELIKDVANINLKKLSEIFTKTINAQVESAKSIEPITDFDIKGKLSSDLTSIGLEKVLSGKVALLLVAGGQGTRLSSTQPKGMYDIGFESKSSLFQIQAERVLALQKRSKNLIHWYIMTSSFTHHETVQFFQDYKFFGLDSAQVIFFNQNNLPCMDFDGKIIMASSHQVSWAPNGNGGMYSALNEQGILSHMKKKGIEYVHLYCVDNVLVQILDPTLVGYASTKDVEFVAKVVPKRSWNEGVGVFGLKNGHLNVIEYSEITEEMAKKEVNGQLEYNHSNFVNFLYRLDFLEKCATLDLPYHIAKKKIPYFSDGQLIQPTKENGIKMELFNFDVCPFLTSFAILLVDRENEFSPLKNHIGKDSPDSCKSDLSLYNISCLKKIGVEVSGEGICEISPLFDINTLKGKTVHLPCWIK